MSAQSCSRRRPRAAFTLVELLVATVLAVLIMFAVSHSISSTLRSEHLGRRRLARSDLVWQRAQRLRRDLQSLVPRLPSEDDAKIELLLLGSARQVVIRSRPEPSESKRQPIWIRYGSVDRERGQWQRHLQGREILEVNLPFESVRFRYLDGQQWVEQWNERDTLPRAVEMEIREDGESTRLVVNLRSAEHLR